MQKILIIEDCKSLSASLKSVLTKEYAVTVVERQADAKNFLEKEKFDLIVLDLGLPDGHGFEICEYLKSKKLSSEMQILIVSGNFDVESIVKGLELGADDFLAKPFNRNEFYARIRARLRKKNIGSVREIDPFEVNIKKQRISILENGAKRDLDLTKYEYHLLCFFLENLNQVFSRGDLVKLCFGTDYNISERAIDLHIFSIRKKIGEGRKFIETVYGLGYRLII